MEKMAEKRSIPEILDDVRKCEERMSMNQRVMGSGFTLRQRIYHHEMMTGFLKELLEAGGTADNL